MIITAAQIIFPSLIAAWVYGNWWRFEKSYGTIYEIYVGDQSTAIITERQLDEHTNKLLEKGFDYSPPKSKKMSSTDRHTLMKRLLNIKDRSGEVGELKSRIKRMKETGQEMHEDLIKAQEAAQRYKTHRSSLIVMYQTAKREILNVSVLQDLKVLEKRLEVSGDIQPSPFRTPGCVSPNHKLNKPLVKKPILINGKYIL